jgi:Conserved TM helix
MREMIISELSQALHEIARGFAHFLPRLIVMLILALVGWLIAYLVKVALRSILRLIKFDKLSENAGASQLLSKAALPPATEMLSRFVFWIAWLGFILLGVSVLGILQKCFFFCRVSLWRCSSCSSDFWQPASFPALLCWLR